MKEPENINELTAKYFAGEEMTFLEKQQFQKWREENDAEYDKLSKLIKPFDVYEPEIEVNTSLAWQHMDAKLESHKRSLFKAKFTRIITVAASILLLIGISFFLLQKEEKVIRYKSGGTQTTAVKLPDGSLVNLYPKSVLEYRSEKSKRDIVLIGKAFFKVKRDTLRPFSIQTAEMNVEVLGTSFLIDATISEQPAVFVKTGIVRVSTHNQEEILKHNQKASLINGNILSKDTILNTAIFDLNKPVISLNFSKTSLKDVIEKVEKCYNVTIELKNVPEGNVITTVFNKNSIDEVLNELSYLCHLKYTKVSEQYFVLYAGYK